MKQRDIQDADKVRWQCVQAYAGIQSEHAERATELVESENSTVTVVCTPSGGAQTVRLSLPANWDEAMNDEALVQKIQDANK